MVFDDWSQCPSCKFPALYSSLVAYCSSDNVCPMCEKEILSEAIEKVHDPSTLLRPVTEDSGDKDGDEGAEEKSDDA